MVVVGALVIVRLFSKEIVGYVAGKNAMEAPVKRVQALQVNAPGRGRLVLLEKLCERSEVKLVFWL